MSNDKMSSDKRILVGEFGRAHGVRGEVRLKSYTADPFAIASYGPLAGEDGATYVIESLRAQGDMLVARVAGVSDRAAAEALTRIRLYVARDKLAAEALEEDEFLQADLVGLSVETTDGRVIGRVVDLPNYGAGDLVEIALTGRRDTVLLPFSKAFVPTVDVAGGRIVVDAPEDVFEPARARDPGQPS
ncbi:ribosome maturation factor RimM [Chelatococcus sp. SYSU_G07232]|uniref:Ribosome maturation factor RimM n=1 Tax=Chelatococcus albus TaxID=3047466 RepID=A0ABT7AK33_9HYPH|nr:ribosome maturation factor RimM [Chelatococcus sp. SYSU_G07232]MDJ1159718.1 ribosome maturation factor RimM [Chelatococcus sp. SYSU_G07232]